MCRVTVNMAAAIVFALLAHTGIYPALAAGDSADMFTLPTPEPSSTLDRLLKGRFSELSREFEARENGFLSGELSEDEVLSGWDVFLNSDPAIREHLDAWITADPASYAPRAARGMYFTHISWTVRGTGWASALRPGQVRRMSSYLAAAERDFEAALHRNPKLGIAYGRLIEITMLKGGNLEDYFIRARKTVPQSAYFRRSYRKALRPEWYAGNAANRLMRLHVWKRISEADAEKWPAAAIPPGTSAFNKGLNYALGGKYDLAESWLDTAIEEKRYAHYHLERGWIRYRQKRFADAQADFETALEAMPNADVFRALSLARARQDDWVEAAKLLHRAVERDPYNPVYLLDLTAALMRAKQDFLPPEDDTTLIPTGIDLPEARCRPDGKPPLQSRFSLAGRWSAAAWRHHCGIMTLLDRALVYGGGDPKLHDRRGDHFLRYFGRSDLAVPEFRSALAADPNNAWYLYEYGLSLYETEPCFAVPVLIKYIQMCAQGRACEGDQMAPIWLTDIADNAGCAPKVTAAAKKYPFISRK